MRNLFILVMTILSLSSAATAAAGMIKVDFENSGEELFAQGKLTGQTVVVNRAYNWIAGSFSIDFTYNESVLSETLTCYQLDYSKVSTGDSTQMAIHSVPFPTRYFCSTYVNTEVTVK